MASPTDAADTLEAWRQDNFGWMTPAENRMMKALIAGLVRQAEPRTEPCSVGYTCPLHPVAGSSR